MKSKPAKVKPAKTYSAIKKNKGKSLYRKARADMDKKFNRRRK